MDSIDPSKGMSTLDATMEDSCGDRPKAPRKKMGPVEKEASVHEEMKRMQKLPTNSTYVTHRLRVLNKILQLLSIQSMICCVLCMILIRSRREMNFIPVFDTILLFLLLPCISENCITRTGVGVAFCWAFYVNPTNLFQAVNLPSWISVFLETWVQICSVTH
ncbi:unnamed protein product [Prunus armeniaca]|uniref:Uncharacterized protein n=1 Tax=Prunus armeniaca TaxID=36596 RepID=A0A6J5UNP9_PRUAR|nr:unnamed protein product [Prunus armeniaca]